MPMPGYVFKDGGPIPDDELQGPPPSMIPLGDGLMVARPHATNPSTSNSSSVLDTPTSSTSPSHTSQSHISPSYTSSSFTSPSYTSPSYTSSSYNSSSHVPTESHALANADHDLKGATQIDHHEPGVKDLGWTEPPENIPKPLVGGLPNEHLWMLVRRFNKQMYHVKAINYDPPGGLDLNVADEDEFSPDKLRANIERLYMTVILGLMGSGNHIARLRSWREPRRTVAFCAAYFFAWAFNFLVPLFFTTLIVLIVLPPSRHYLFPPAPLALVNTKTGGIQSPKAGVLGSHDSATGAPEKYQGEAVEQEASNFVSSFTAIALSSAIGKHDQSSQGGKHPIEKKAPDPTKAITDALDAKDSTSTGSSPAHHDKTKQPMEEAMWTKMRPIMHVIGDLADGWERFANALSPTPPFPKETARMRLAGILVAAVAVALLTSSSMFMKMTTFFVGGGFFGDPIITRAYAVLNHEFPDWQKYVELRRTILKGVPTNAQLTLTLLRVGEANKAPIPPPPRSDSKEAPPDRPASLHADNLQLDASNAEIHDAIHADPNAETHSMHEETEAKPKHRHGSRILGFLKGTTKTSVETKLGIDKLRANMGSKPAQEHLGVLPTPEEQKPSGPVDFKARYHGNKGYIYITTTATTPCVSFAPQSTEGTGEARGVEPIFTVAVADIKELKKIGGLGWKAKLIVGWATDREIADGLEIVDRMGQTWKVTALPLRDELFNRLVAINGQKWESY